MLGGVLIHRIDWPAIVGTKNPAHHGQAGRVVVCWAYAALLRIFRLRYRLIWQQRV